MNLGPLVNHLLQHYGYVAVFGLPMLESAGIPIPGETMLLAAAVFAATTGHLNIVAVIACAAAGAVLGGNFGYLLGRRAGRAAVLRYGRYVRLGERQLRLGELFFELHGDRTVFIARFFAVLRTIGAFLAGTSRMPFRSFMLFNALGGVAWAVFYGMVAFFLGRQFDRYQGLVGRVGLGLAVLAVVVVVGSFVVGRKSLERWALGGQER